MLRRCHAICLRLLLALSLAPLGLSPVHAAPADSSGGQRQRMEDLLCFTRTDYTRFVVQFTDNAEDVLYRVHEYPNNRRVFYVDFYNLRPYFADQDLDVNDGLLQRVQVRNYRDQNAIRIIFYIQSLDDFARVSAPEADGHSLVIDFLRRDVTTTEIADTTTRQLTGARRVIVIDPGHGGRDVGAESRRRIGGRIRREADLNLEIARILQRRFNDTGQFEALLTRADDRYMSLEDRVDYAQRMRADLFLSVHCNHAGDPRRYEIARGLELFYLSSRGITDHADELADERSGQDGGDAEHLEHLLQGRGRQMSQQSYIVCQYLRWAFRRDRYWRQQSRGGDGNFRFIQDKNFHVLRNFSMPCVLVECGYMSHTEECALLINREFQDSIAQHVVDGITRYFIDEEAEEAARASRPSGS